MRYVALLVALSLPCQAQQFRAPITIGGGAQLAAAQATFARVGRAPLPRPAPPLGVEWLNGEPQLAGKALLVRFWTIDCGYCVATAPALEDLHRRYASRGLQVIGVHHPKSEAGKSDDVVRARAKSLGITFPIAQDRDWKTLDRWWPEAERRFTSATLLVDRKGMIRFAHEGGEFHASTDRKHRNCDRDRDRVEAAVREVLAE